MGGHILIVGYLVLQTVLSQQIFNPVNNLPPPGQSPIFAKTPSSTPPGAPVFAPVPTQPIFGPPSSGPSTTSRPIFSFMTVGRIVQEAVEIVRDEDETMRRRLNSDIDLYPHDLDTPDPLIFSESPENATEFSLQSRRINWIGRLLKRYNMGRSLSSVLASSEARSANVYCPYTFTSRCQGQEFSRYRTIDGKCNNLQNPLWGSSFIPFTRSLDPVYETQDGRDDAPRRTKQGGEPLPDSRAISVRFHEPAPSSNEESIFSMLLTVFGQFLAHDLTDRAPTKGFNGAVLKCCDQGRIPTPDGVCDNIPIPQRDIFRQFKGNCLDFARSLEVTDIACSKGTREQLNQATSYIDGGAIYGATKEKYDSLRQYKGGLLMTSVPNHLPITPAPNTASSVRGFAFYAAGDNRVNEFIGLIGIETMWVREHNRIATELARLNPQWNDETVFQEARRIIIALIQHITYAEYLPAILGPALITKYRLQLLAAGHYSSYNRRQDPGLSNVFATVAMRFGHSMLRTTYTLRNRDNQRNGDLPIELKDSFFRPQTFLSNENPFMRGMAADSSEMCDRVLSGGAINNLYETDPGSGSDLAAANLQRGRDHGIPDYSQWRRLYQLPTSGLPDHDADTRRRLLEIYGDVQNIDAFAGGISEKPVAQGAVGPLFGNILAEQFKKLKEGDRYWYETSSKPQAFNEGQLKQIRKITLATILCNTYSFEKIQERALYMSHSQSNKMVFCASLPQMDLDYWRAI